MAGPLSSEEIEDVVSSVRRLVSNELSPRRLSRDLGADRLLLTPALRVVSEISPLAPLVVGEKSALEPVPDPEPVEVAQTFDDAVELIEAEWEDEIWLGKDTAPLGEVALGAEEAEVLARPNASDADAMTEAEAVWIEPQSSAPIPLQPLRARAESLAARLAAGEVHRPATAEGQQALAEERIADDPQMQDIAQMPAGSTLPEDAPLDAPATADPAPEPEVMSDLPEGASGDETALDAVSAPDTLSQRMPTEIIDADGTPLAVLDEAALQEIVRQMIREELQGDLGERITRNVRKLVRAEINRALMARDLD